MKHFVSAGQPGHSHRKASQAPELCSVWQNCSRDGNQRWKDTEKVLKLGACGLAGRSTRVGSFMSGYHWNDQQMNIGDGGQSSMEDQIPFIDITNQLITLLCVESQIGKHCLFSYLLLVL